MEKRIIQSNGLQKAVSSKRTLEQDLADFDKSDVSKRDVATMGSSPVRTNPTLQAPTSSTKPAAPKVATPSLHHKMMVKDTVSTEPLSSSTQHISAARTKSIDMSIQADESNIVDSKQLSLKLVHHQYGALILMILRLLKFTTKSVRLRWCQFVKIVFIAETKTWKKRTIA